MKLSNILNINFILIKFFGVVFFLGIFNQLFAQDFNFNYAKSFGGIYPENVSDMSIDSAGNIVLTGSFYESVDFDPSAQADLRTAQGGTDIFIAKFNSSGEFLWVQTIGGWSYETAYGVDFDSNGNIIFAGVFQTSSPLDVDPSENSYYITNNNVPNGTLIPSQQGFIVKLNSEGVFQWVHYAPLLNGTTFQHLEINSFDEVVFTGTAVVSYGGYYNNWGLISQAYVCKLSPDGQIIWTKNIGSGGFGISQLDIDNLDEIIIGGWYYTNSLSNVYVSANGTFSVIGNGQFIVKINSVGDFTLGISLPNTSTSNLTLSAGTNGSFFLSSTSNNSLDIAPSTNESFIVGNIIPQCYIAKYSSDGNFIWGKTFDNPETNLTFYDISESSNGDLFLCGYFNGQVDFNPSPSETSLSNVSTPNTAFLCLLKLSSNGDYIAKRIIGANLSITIPSVATVTNNGDYYIAGRFTNTTEFNPNQEFTPDTGQITNVGNNGMDDVFLTKFSTCTPSDASAIISPESQILCVNTNAQTLNLIYNGSAIVDYQWYYSSSQNNADGTIVPGATSSTYTPPTNSPINYYYYCKSSIPSTGCSLNSSTVHVTVLDAPNITSQAIDIQTICVGGEPLPLTINTSNPAGIDTYQWYSNSVNSNSGGVPIAGATSNSFTPTNTSIVSSTYYYCVVCGVTATNAFLINVVSDPVITIQPITNQTICMGGTPAPLSTSVSEGTGVFSFQWYNAATNIPIVGANASSYTPTFYSSPNNYNYYLQVSQSGLGCNTMYSNNSVVTVIADPIVTSTPTSQSICVNGGIMPIEASFTGGVGTISYQWYQTTNNSYSGGTLVSGATASSYSAPTNVASNYYYYATVNLSGSGCSANSPTSLVAVSPAPSFSAQPIASQTICIDGTPNTLSVNYSNGAGSPVYQWWSNSINSTNNATLISGANSASFIPNSSVVGTTYYFCIVTFSASNCGFITSNISSVTVVPDPVIAWQPIGSIICVGGEANPLSVDVSGGVGTFTYQWYNSATGNPIAGANSALFYPGTFNSTFENSYYVQVNQSGSGCDALTSSPALVTVVDDPTLSSTAPAYQIICEQSNIDSIEILVSGGTQLSYQWFIAPNSTSVGNPITNATSLIFTPTFNAVSNNFYYCQVTSLGNGCTSSINSSPLQIEIVGQPQITNSAYSVEACLNNTIPTLEIVGNYDANPNIHFFQSSTINTYDGSEVSSTNFTPNSNDLGNYSYYFTYNVDYPGCIADTSDFYNVSITDIPTLTLGSNESLIGCVGAEIELTNFVQPNLNSDYILVWNLDNSLSDTTYSNNVFATLPIESAGNHNMQVQISSTLQYCSVTDELNLSIDIVPDPSITEEQNFIQSLCPFDEEIDAPTVLVDFDNLIGTPTYSWNKVEQGGIIPIANSNQNSYLPQLPLHGIFNSQCVIAFDYPGCDVLTSSLSKLTFDDNNLDCFPELVIPEAISPNNDGMNDYWIITGIEQFNSYEINIFNSFGQSIYFVKNTPPNWDGMWNGQTLPNGDYFYAVKLIELNRTVFGTVSVMK